MPVLIGPNRKLDQTNKWMCGKLKWKSLKLQTQLHPEFTGPSLGPKMAEKNERTFTEEQLRASEGQLNLQMGYNKGASQAGHGGMGNSRHM